MPISVTCDGCGNTVNVPDEHAGKRGKCKRCGQPIRVPSPELVEVFSFTARDDSDEPRASSKPEPQWDIPAIAVADEDFDESGPEVDVLSRRPVKAPGIPAVGPEPWYYRVLVIYAYLIVGLGLSVAVILAAGMLAMFFVSEGERNPLVLAYSLVFPVAIGFASAVVGAPILLGVDLVRHVRAIRQHGLPGA